MSSIHLLRVHRARARLTAGVVGYAVDVPAEDIMADPRGSLGRSAARQLVMYLLHSAFSMSLAQIAAALGRDRSTVAHGVRKVEDRREAPAFDRWVETLEDMLRVAPDPVLREEDFRPEELA